jgi:hypothetical protein
VSEARQLKFKLGELDLTLKPAMTYADMKRLKEFGELARTDPMAAVDLVILLFWKCAHAGDPSVTKDMIEENAVMPDGVQDLMLALLRLGDPVPNERVM